MSTKTPLSPILAKMRTHINGNITDMRAQLARIDTLMRARKVITEHRDIAQVLADAFEAAREETGSEEARSVTSYLTIDAVRTLAAHEPWRAAAGFIRLAPEEAMDRLSIVIGEWLKAWDNGKSVMLIPEGGQPAQAEQWPVVPYNLFIGPEALRTLLQGGKFETTRTNRTITVELTKGALATVDSLVGSTYSEEDVADGNDIDDEKRVKTVHVMQEERGQEPQEAPVEEPEPAPESETEVVEQPAPMADVGPETLEPDPEDPVDDIDYEVQTLDEETAGADTGGEDIQAPEPEVETDHGSPAEPAPKAAKPAAAPKPLVPTEEQAKVEDKLLTIIHTVRAKTRSDDVMFSRSVLAEKIGEPEIKLMLALTRLRDRGILKLNDGAPKNDVSLTFIGTPARKKGA